MVFYPLGTCLYLLIDFTILRFKARLGGDGSVVFFDAADAQALATTTKKRRLAATQMVIVCKRYAHDGVVHRALRNNGAFTCA